MGGNAGSIPAGGTRAGRILGVSGALVPRTPPVPLITMDEIKEKIRAFCRALALVLALILGMWIEHVRRLP